MTQFPRQPYQRPELEPEQVKSPLDDPRKDEDRTHALINDINRRLKRAERTIRAILPNPYAESISQDIALFGAVKTYLEFDANFSSTGANGPLMLTPIDVTLPGPAVRYVWVDVEDGHIKIRRGDGTDIDLETGTAASSAAQFLTLALDANLSAERVFTPGTALSGVAGVGVYTLNHSQVSTGDLHQDYPLAAGTETISGTWTHSALLAMSGADIRLAAAGNIEDSGGNDRITLTSGGEGLLTGNWRVTLELEIDGDIDHDGTNVGFYGVAPVARASAYTQTFSTADKTHAAFTSADIGAFTGGAVGFLDAAERDNIRTQFNALRADVDDVKRLANSIIDDLQAIGIVQ